MIALGLRQPAGWAMLPLGFFLQFNFIPQAFEIPLHRASDLFMLFGAAMSPFVVLRKSRNPAIVVSYTVVLALCLARIVFAPDIFRSPKGFDVQVPILYLLSGTAAFYYLEKMRADRAIERFGLGLILGAAASLAVMVAQDHGGFDLVSLGLTPPLATLNTAIVEAIEHRYPGLWGHPNEASHVIAMTGPAVAYFLTKKRRIVLAIMATGIMLGSFYFTLGRGGLMAFTLTALLALVLDNLRFSVRRALYATVALGLLAPVIYAGAASTLLYKRLAEDRQISSNISERLDTQVIGVKMALEHPFGINHGEAQTTLGRMMPFTTPHSGFLSLAYAMGTPYLVALLASLAVILWRSRARGPAGVDVFMFFLAVQITTSSMFEELAYDPTYTFFVGLLITYALTVAAPDTFSAEADRSTGTRGHAFRNGPASQ